MKDVIFILQLASTRSLSLNERAERGNELALAKIKGLGFKWKTNVFQPQIQSSENGFMIDWQFSKLKLRQLREEHCLDD